MAAADARATPARLLALVSEAGEAIGSRGGSAPNGLKRVEASTLFLRAPYQDWSALSQGHKTEFRVPMLGAFADRAIFAPTAIVLYSVSSLGRRVEKLMVLHEHRRERLMDIADQPESMRREGVIDYDHFRRYWRGRSKRPFRALQEVEVFEIGPWNDDLIDALGRVLVRRLYAGFLAQPLSDQPTGLL